MSPQSSVTGDQTIPVLRSMIGARGASVMSLPGATAECSLYKSTQPYRAVTCGILADGGIHLAGCMDDCMAECNADHATCRFECRAHCGPRPPTCPPGYRAC